MIILKFLLYFIITLIVSSIIMNYLIIYIKLKFKNENKIVWNMEQLEKLEYCEQCYDDMPIDHVCLTCCGDEITGWVEDYMICPTCKEHI